MSSVPLFGEQDDGFKRARLPNSQFCSTLRVHQICRIVLTAFQLNLLSIVLEMLDPPRSIPQPFAHLMLNWHHVQHNGQKDNEMFLCFCFFFSNQKKKPLGQWRIQWIWQLIKCILARKSGWKYRRILWAWGKTTSSHLRLITKTVWEVATVIHHHWWFVCLLDVMCVSRPHLDHCGVDSIQMI